MTHPIGFRRISITIALTGTSVAISETKLLTPSFEVHAPAANSGNIFIGSEDVDTTWIPRVAGSTTAFGAAEEGGLVHGDFFDLSKVFIDATSSGDTAIIQYLAKEK